MMIIFIIRIQTLHFAAWQPYFWDMFMFLDIFLSFWILWDILDILWPALLVLYALFSAHFGLIIHTLCGIFSYLQDLLP